MIISDMDCVNAYVNWDITKPEAVEAWKRIRIFIEESCKKPEKKPANKIKPRLGIVVRRKTKGFLC